MFDELKTLIGGSGNSPYSHPVKGIAVAAGTAVAFLLWLVLLTGIIHLIA